MNFIVEVRGQSYTDSVAELKKIDGVEVGRIIGAPDKLVNIEIKIDGETDTIKEKIIKITGFLTISSIPPSVINYGR